MAVEDVVLPSGVTLTPEDLKVIAPLVKEMLAEESKEISQFPVLDSIAGVSSLPGMTQQNELVRVPLSVLKGLDGKQVEIAASSTAIQWRYVGATSWNIIVELSVLEGAQGKPGVPPILTSGIVSTLPYNSSATAEVVSAGETEEGVPMYKINLGVPQGKPGQDGDGAGNVYVPTDNISAEKYYVFKAKVDNSVNGEFVELDNISFGVGQNYPNSVNAEIFNDYDNNIALGDYSHAEGTGIAVSYEVDIFSISNEGEGVVFSSYPSSMTFEVGDIHLIDNVYYKILFIEYSEVVVGETMLTLYYDKPVHFSTSINEIKKVYSVAYGESSHKEGKFSNAIGIASHAEGTYTVSVGDSAHAEGKQTRADGIGSHAEGYMTFVYGSNSHSEGRETWCLGSQSHVEGLYTINLGDGSHAEGIVQSDFSVGGKTILYKEDDIRNFKSLYTTRTYPYGDTGAYFYKINDTTLEKFYLHASFGVGTHLEGINNIVCDKGGHVEGYNNICGDMIPGMEQDSTVYCPHVEGMNNRVESRIFAAHVGGSNNVIYSGNYSFAHGFNLKVYNDYEVAFGRYNVSEIEGKKVLFSYGIGTSDTVRENAFSVLEDGSVYIPKMQGGSIQEQIQSAINDVFIPLNNKINNNYNELKAIIDEQSQQINDLFVLLQSGVGGTKAFVAGSVLVFTKNITTEVTGETLFITDSETTVENGVLTIK